MRGAMAVWPLRPSLVICHTAASCLHENKSGEFWGKREIEKNRKGEIKKREGEKERKAL